MSFVPAKKNTAYICYVGLPSQSNPLVLQANPTLAAGDVKICIDDGAPANLATLPAVDADFTKRVKVSLSSDEMNGDNLTIIFSDAAGAEWCDLIVNIQTATNQIDGIYNAVVAAAPTSHTAASSTDTTGSIVSGTYANTTTDDNTYWQIAPVTPAVGGFGLNVSLNFNIGTGRVPDSVLINGRYYAAPAAGSRGVDVQAYNYLTSSYDTISNTVTRFDNSAADETFQYSLLPAHRQVATGNVIIRFTSTSTNTSDDFYCDRVNVSSVALAAAGLTADAIQQAVWARADSGHDEDTLGYNLSKIHIKSGQIVSATDATRFVIDFNIPANDIYNGMIITLEDKTDDHYETRRIVDTIAASNEIIVDRAFGFTPVASDDYYIMNNYADVNVTHILGTAQTAGDIVAAVITNAAGVDIAADIIALKAETVTILADTNELQGDDYPTSIAALPTAAEIKTAIEAAGSHLALILEDSGTTLPGLIAALNNISVADITGVEVDNDGTAISLAGALKLILAVLAGKSSGGGTATLTFRDIADAKNRISATVDSSGNRTAIGTRDAT